MVATSDCVVKTKPIAEKKASKPLMEKKRRARINKCLDQLKYLLDNYYTSNIRKRKLEKADILELTVKHLRNLQKIQSSSATASEFSDHQAGYRSCLASVNEYLLMADNSNGRDCLILSHLSKNLCCAVKGQGESSSTLESDLSKSMTQEAAMQRLFPSTAGHEMTSIPLTRCFRALRPHSTSTGHASHSPSSDVKEKRLSSGTQQVLGAEPTYNIQEKTSSSVCCHSVKESSNEVGGIPNVWRPW